MTALLKDKSKIKIERKPRVQYPVGESLKRIREPSKNAVVDLGKSAIDTSKTGTGTIGQSQAQTQSQTQDQQKKTDPRFFIKKDADMKKE